MAKFEDYDVKLWDLEGGFSNNPLDKGGPTNRGVTLATFRAFYGYGTIEDIRNLSFGQFSEIAKKRYWDRWKADLINNQSIAEFLVDWVYNSGSWGIKIPQRILKVDQDGIVGKKTILAVNTLSGDHLFNDLQQARGKFYWDIVKHSPSQSVFIDGWINRNNSFKYIK